MNMKNNEMPDPAEGLPEKGMNYNNCNLKLRPVLKNILKHVQEGILFLNRRFEVEPLYSDASAVLLGTGSLAGKSFLSLLDKRVPEEVIRHTTEFLEILFREDLDEETVNDLNPLSRIELFYEDEQGILSNSRYLSFRFRRLMEKQEICGIIVTVQNNSMEANLTRKLKQTEERTHKQMEWLVNLLHVEPSLLNDFFSGVEKEITNIEKSLKTARGAEKPFEILENIYRSLYIIKGNASLLDLRFFSELSGRFLDTVTGIKSRAELTGSDFVPVVIQLGELRKTLNEVISIFKRISHFHNHFRAKRSYESELLVNSLRNLIRSLSEQLGKHVEFDYSDFDALSIPYSSRHLVRDVLFLLIRNTILYAVEDSEERQSSGKPNIAKLKISSFIAENKLGLVLRHDGRIERIERLLKRIIETGAEPRQKNERYEGMQVTQLLFMPNIQFNDENEMVANYSMDMELLKKKLREKGGRLKITFTSEQNCEFAVLLPLKQ
ncbi:MAG: hypothetical protein WAN36_09945 [Calditrichia bacterium]